MTELVRLSLGSVSDASGRVGFEHELLNVIKESGLVLWDSKLFNGVQLTDPYRFRLAGVRS